MASLPAALSSTANTSLAEQVARTIEREIGEGRFQQAELIGTKEQLQRRFNVARGTLNEAIQLLRARDLVDLRPGPKGGVFVAQPSPFARFGELVLGLRDASNLAAQCYAVKDALDPWIAADAAGRRTSADVRELREILRRMKRAVTDHAVFGAVNWELHRRVAAIAGNVVMRALYLAVLDVIQAEVTGADGDVAFNQVRYEVHSRLVDAIAAQDTEAAFRAGGEDHRLPIRPAPAAKAA
jgi:GntR family transcriptional regulator, transcriptional repressor for pyruvate dehydrogenase complex